MAVPHHSIFTGRMLFRPASSVKALKAKLINTEANIYYADDHMRNKWNLFTLC